MSAPPENQNNFPGSISLKKLDIRKIKNDHIVLLIGKHNAGKSFLTRDILYHHQDFPRGVVINPTENTEPFYTNIVSKASVHTEYTSNITRKIVKRQMESRSQIVEGSGSGSLLNHRAFLVMDNCLYDNDWKKDKYLHQIFMNNRQSWHSVRTDRRRRHLGIMFILTIPYPIGIPPNLRADIDWIFLFRETYHGNLHKLYEFYSILFPTFEMFCQVMDACTDDYNCLVIHNSAPSNRLEDQIYWYKAEAHEDNFHIGCP